MFWGLIMEPNKRYTQTVDKSFHVSMASLDLSTADDQTIQVMLCLDGRNFLLCSLNKSKTWQVPLDLNFQEGTNIAFTCNGRGNVHLTGYLISEDDLDGLEEEDEDEESIPQLMEKNIKRKASNSFKDAKNVKRAKSVDSSSEDDDEDDDADLLGDLDDDSEDSEEEEEEEDENMMMDDDDSDELEDEEDGSDDEEQIQDKKQTKKKDKSLNPANKQPQQQQQNKQQNQQIKKKEDKQKMVNGTDNKQDHQSKKQKKNKPDQQQPNQQQNAQSEPKKRIVEGGVQVEDLKVGNGTLAKPGKFVSVYYVGRLKNGKKFDATTQGEGFKFRLGKGEVIKGWDVGVAGMKVGGKRRLVIPPAMAYGAKGSPPVIPGNSQLMFEVELRNVH